MHKTMRRTLLAAVWTASLTLVVSPALAATIDFTDASVWGGATGNSSYTATIGGVGVTAQAQPASQGAVLQQSAFGMGVNHQDPTYAGRAQIDGGELLQLGFDQAVTVNSFSVDLFSTDITFSKWRLNVYQDKGKVYYTDVNGNQQLGGSILSGWDFSTFGASSFGLNLPALTGIDFSTYGTFSDYSLRSVSFSAATTATVPELDPSGATAALCLLLGSMVIVADRRRALIS